MSASRGYLTIYNGVECALWSLLTIPTVFSLVLGFSYASDIVRSSFPLLAFTQTAALLEIAHAASGIVRASPATTALQIGGKCLIVWSVMAKFPGLIAGAAFGQTAYLSCLLAWGASEMIRYAFFFLQLTLGKAPDAVLWLRYNAFLVLYPIGLLSEAALIWLALREGTGYSAGFKAYMMLGLATYLPAGPYLYSHMLSQRRKALAGPSTKRSR